MQPLDENDWGNPMLYQSERSETNIQHRTRWRHSNRGSH